MKHNIKLSIPKDHIEEIWLKEQALLLSACCYEKVVFNKEHCYCSKCKLKTKIIN